jgi:hypothetical protein
LYSLQSDGLLLFHDDGLRTFRHRHA